MGATEKLLADALRLSVGERAKLVAELVASLPSEGSEPAQGYESAWAEVIAERTERVLDGTADYEDEPWADAHARVAASLVERRKGA